MEDGPKTIGLAVEQLAKYKEQISIADGNPPR